ncbi:ABC transporter permease [Luteibacter yeojuensis]|uniref:FtsX-like permease family protein n=1 Tax=Luteibacter yeojuensis TaxID=345309 RepID=A0A7X5TPX4_9GAMM|nr:ABC transporter permease [Luteibacter yeojuensis]NID15530.1 FtsX-like permease family protein [Luteibacter yeojuensis]
MFGYYVELALRSLRLSRALTALMILAVALGIGASMTTLTVLHVLSGDPLPGKSSKVFMPRLDPRDKEGYDPTDELPVQVTWADGMNLLHAHRARRQALMTAGATPVQSDDAAIDPFIVPARYTTTDFFPMFDVPFRFGQGWSAADDASRARVAVIGADLNDRLFHGENSVGRIVHADGVDLRIVGVLAPWRAVPHFYDLNTGNYSVGEEVFVPLGTARDAKLKRNGGLECWGNKSSDEEGMETANCVWLQLWVELDDAAAVVSYRAFLDGYARDQVALGRFERPARTALPDVMRFLDEQRVVPSDVRLQVWLAFGFFLVCLVNTVGLMLAKFMRRAGEVGVRRALGASRRSVFAQLLTEAAIIGVAGGIVGLGVAFLGLAIVRMQPGAASQLAHLDLAMLLVTFLVSIAATLAAGLIPAWRTCRIAPALQIKSQ